MRVFLACWLLLVSAIGCSGDAPPSSTNDTFDESQWDMNAPGGEPTLKDVGP